MRRQWRCFHCDELFTTAAAAQQHFGRTQLSDPACTIDIARFREMELNHERHNAEDSDAERQMYRMAADHLRALQREEEKGYERGLRDARAELKPP